MEQRITVITIAAILYVVTGLGYSIGTNCSFRLIPDRHARVDRLAGAIPMGD